MPNSPTCVDASLVLRLVVDPSAQAVHELWNRWDAEGRAIASPTLLFYEVSNALHQYQRRGLLSGPAVRLALEAALSLPIRLHGGPELHRQALDLADRAVRHGYEWIVDADIKRFFDTVDHEKLLDAVNEEVADGSVLYLIRKFLKAGVLAGTEKIAVEQGTPQGGPRPRGPA